MDGGLNLSSYNGTFGGTAAKAVSPSFDYASKFEELCPYYMSIGMTYDEYWNGDNYLPRYYLKADKFRRKQKDEEMWLQGRYIYEAMGALSPLFQTFSKKKKPDPYVEKPFLSDILETKQSKEEKEFKKSAKIMDLMMAEINATIRKRKEEENNAGQLRNGRPGISDSGGVGQGGQESRYSQQEADRDNEQAETYNGE